MPFRMISTVLCIKVSYFWRLRCLSCDQLSNRFIHMQRFMAWVGGLHLVSVTLLTFLWFTSLHRYLGEGGDGACHLSELLAFC
jgi:hypothetical protein